MAEWFYVVFLGVECTYDLEGKNQSCIYGFKQVDLDDEDEYDDEEDDLAKQVDLDRALDSPGNLLLLVDHLIALTLWPHYNYYASNTQVTTLPHFTP